MKTATQTTPPNVKFMVIVKGRGTAHEQRIQTTIPMYWVESYGRWVTIPE